MTDHTISKIHARANAATSGPWTSFIEGRDFTSGSSFIMTGTEESRGKDIELIGATEADQDFIAAARTDIPKLILEITRLRKLLKRHEIDF